jgi:aminopeptidase YwaD
MMMDLGASDREMIAEIWTSAQAWQTCRDLIARFPNRYGGHDDEVGARDFVAGRLREFGLEVRVEEFDCNHWHPDRAALTVRGAQGEILDVPCVGLPMSGGAAIEADVVYLDEGTPAQFAAAGDRVRGRIVMVNSRCPGYSHRPRTCRRDKYLQAVAAGAAGFIYMRHEGGLLPEVYHLASDGPAPLPGVSITREAGATVLERIREGTPVRLEVDARIAPGRSWNVVADLPGLRGAPEILVGAHYDTLIGCPGAIDDASGAAVMLEAARVLGRHRGALGARIRFVSFGRSTKSRRTGCGSPACSWRGCCSTWRQPHRRACRAIGARSTPGWPSGVWSGRPTRGSRPGRSARSSPGYRPTARRRACGAGCPPLSSPPPALRRRPRRAGPRE